jgi:hypothetical protein
MRHGYVAATTILISALVGRAVHAQDADARNLDALAPGTRVRVLLPEQERQSGSTRGGHLVRGTLVRLTADTMYVAVTDSLGPLAIPRHYVQRLDRSRGVPSAVGSGLRRGLIGGVACAGVGLLLAAGDNSATKRPYGEWALAGGATCFAVGATLGALFPTERWQRVRLAPVVAAGRVDGVRVAWRGRF